MKQILYVITSILFIVCGCTYTKNDESNLRNKLHKIYRLDQHYRMKLSTLPPTSMEAIKLWKKQNLIDSTNLIVVSKILDSLDSLHQYEFDDSAWTALFMVIQHSNLQQQEKYLSLFQNAADKNEIQPFLVAKMVDRIRVGKGQRQIYGTQAIPIKDPKTGFITDKYELAPIEDEENVNQRRLKVGLPPIQEGAKELGVEYKPKSK